MAKNVSGWGDIPGWEALPTWGDVFAEAEFNIAVTLEIANVRMSFWAIDKSDQEIMGKVRENLKAKGKL